AHCGLGIDGQAVRGWRLPRRPASDRAERLRLGRGRRGYRADRDRTADRAGGTVPDHDRDATDPSHPRLVRRINNGDPLLFDNTTGNTVAFDIDNLQISYDIADSV